MSKTNEAQSSFQKSNLRRIAVQGTRVSLRNALLITSSGICSLDTFVGGGLPVGTICCIEEDISGVYSQLMLKHFIAEGILNNHSIFLASHDSEVDYMVENLPCPVTDADSSLRVNQSSDSMKIAWRYGQMNNNESSTSQSPFGHIYDTSKVLDTEKIKTAKIKHWKCTNTENQTGSNLPQPYLDLLCSIRSEIESSECKIDPAVEKKNLIRIALSSLASPSWSDDKFSRSESESKFLLFLYSLKALMRSSYAVCMLTIPTHLFHENFTLQRLRNIVDIGFQLESFDDSHEDVNEVYREYKGIFRFSKLFAINTIVPHSSERLDLAFKMKRKRFLIEKLCLAPELSGQNDKNGEMTSGCSSNLLHSPSIDDKGVSVGSLEF